MLSDVFDVSSRYLYCTKVAGAAVCRHRKIELRTGKRNVFLKGTQNSLSTELDNENSNEIELGTSSERNYIIA